MYDLLQTGALGNTISLYTSLTDWQKSDEYPQYPDWGVRVATPGDPRMRLYIPTDQVAGYVKEKFPDGRGYNISPMIDRWAVFKGEVFEQDWDPVGLCLYATTSKLAWRDALRDHGRTWHGLAALVALRHYMDPASLEDVQELLARYPGHVVEFSVCSRCVGAKPGRRTVIWEVRKY